MNLEGLGKIFALLTICGIVLNLLGIASNMTVKTLNGGFMPIVSQTFEQPVQLDDRHRFQKQGNLLWLADRIEVNIPEIDGSTPNTILGKSVVFLAKYFDFPLEWIDLKVSIGDIMQFFGIILQLLSVVFVICCIPFMINASIRAGKTWRGR